MDLTGHWSGIAALFVFVTGYLVVTAEERLHLRKSVPVLIAAGLIWLLIGLAYAERGDSHGAAEAFRHTLLEFAELFMFLLVAMTYVNTIEERGVFHALRAWLVSRGLSLRQLFWITGGLAFIISPFIDNLTTALVMGSVAMAVGQGRPQFIALACINIVVAANAGGAFSPFGDITTLMVWQRGLVSFTGFFPLVLPALVNWLVPAGLMALAVETGPPVVAEERVALEVGAVAVVLLFLVTIGLTVLLQHTLHLPPAAGMLFGLGLLKLASFLINRHLRDWPLVVDEPDDVFARPALLAAAQDGDQTVAVLDTSARHAGPTPAKQLDVFRQMERVEWDTLMFFCGIMLAVGGLGSLGYLALVSRALYEGLGPTGAHILVGLISAIIDNIPVMFAVVSMDLDLSHGQWLLVTLTAGVGGSLLSIGSAAGVALMGQARGAYSFLDHLRWSWAVALGYAASIAAHLLINRSLF